MHQDHPRRVMLNGRLKHFRHPHRGSIQRAFVQLLNMDHLVADRQQQHPQVFLQKRTHLIPHHLEHIPRFVDSATFVKVQHMEAPAQFQRGLDLGRFRRAHPMLVLQFHKRRPLQSEQTIHLVQQVLPHLHSILSADTDTQQNGQQLGFAQ